MNYSNFSLVEDTCHSQLITFQNGFGQIYPYAALVICVISVGSNVSNVIILRQPKMRSSTNIILLTIAISDILVCISQIPLIINQNNPDNLNSYVWTMIYIGSSITALLAHTTSLWLGVVLGLFRLLFIRLYPSAMANKYFGIKKAKLSIILTYCLWILLLIPYLTTMRVKIKNSNNKTYYIPTRSTHNSRIEMFNFWNIAFCGKILPCTLTIIFGCCLLSTLKFARDRRRKLLAIPKPSANNSNTDTLNHISKKPNTRLSRRSRDHRRTTLMLVSIILLVLPTELPIACLMLGTRIHESIKCIYLKLGDLLDFLSLLKNFLTFVLYCTMSAEYRSEFKRIFLRFLLNSKRLENMSPLIEMKNNDELTRYSNSNVKKDSLSNLRYQLIPKTKCSSTAVIDRTKKSLKIFTYVPDIETSHSTFNIGH